MSTPSEQATQPELGRDRYRIREPIGKGGQARTYLAEDAATGGQVVVKVLRLDRIDDWKATESFEREARALRSIDHPRVPDYVDHFQSHEREHRYCLVQEYVPGEPLESLIEEGLQVDESEARRLARQMLDVLEYLHGLTPPVVHRDVKPSNILRRPDGEYVLVDFGGVRVVLPDERRDSTIVGSHGYMPHEQMTGRAEPASDLYGLGATLVRLLSRRPPGELVEGARVAFRDHVRVSEEFAQFLEGLLEPSVEDRIGSAERARAVLEGRTPDAVEAPTGWRPDSERLEVQATDDGIEVCFRPRPRFSRLRRWMRYLASWEHGVPAHTFPRHSMGSLLVGIGLLVFLPIGLVLLPIVMLAVWTGEMESPRPFLRWLGQFGYGACMVLGPFAGCLGPVALLNQFEGLESLLSDSALGLAAVGLSMAFMFLLPIVILPLVDGALQLRGEGRSDRLSLRADIEALEFRVGDSSYEWRVGDHRIESGRPEELREIDERDHPLNGQTQIIVRTESSAVQFPTDPTVRDRQRLRKMLAPFVHSGPF